MKKTTRILSAILLIAVLCISLASCAKQLSGKYTADIYGTGTTLTFEEDTVKIAITVTFVGEVASLNATYKIEDDTISFDIADEENVTNSLARQVIESLEAPSPFKETEDYIKIGDTIYQKVTE